MHRHSWRCCKVRWSFYRRVVHLGVYASVRRSHKIRRVLGNERRCLTNLRWILHANWGVIISVYEWRYQYATTKRSAKRLLRATRWISFSYRLWRRLRQTCFMINSSARVEYITNHTRDWTHAEDVCSASICVLRTSKRCILIERLTLTQTQLSKRWDKVCPDNNLRMKDVTWERKHLRWSTILLQYGKPKHFILDETE